MHGSGGACRSRPARPIAWHCTYWRDVLSGAVIRRPATEVAKQIRAWLAGGEAVPDRTREWVDRANDPDATTTVLDALAAEVTAAQVMGTARLNGTGDATTLRDLIREAWRSARARENAAARRAVASFRPDRASRTG
jgi:hypothetical protein